MDGSFGKDGDDGDDICTLSRSFKLVLGQNLFVTASILIALRGLYEYLYSVVRVDDCLLDRLHWVNMYDI